MADTSRFSPAGGWQQSSNTNGSRPTVSGGWEQTSVVYASGHVDLACSYEIESSGATDDFNRADGGLGANWTELHTYAVQITSNAVYSTSGESRGARYSGRTWLDNQSAKGTLVGTLSGSTYLSIGVRYTGTTTTVDGYRASVNSTTWYITRSDNGTGVDIASGSAAFSAGDEIEIRAVGSLISFYLNGTLVGEVIDATYSSGEPGFEIYHSGAGFTSWEGSDLPNYVSSDLVVEYQIGTVNFVDDYGDRMDGPLGADYTDAVGAGLDIVTEQFVGGIYEERGNLRTAETYDVDQFVEFTWRSGTSCFAGGMLRTTGADATRDGYLIDIGSEGAWYIGRYVDGVGTNIASGDTTAPADGDRIRCEITGTLLRLLVNGSLIGSVTDSMYSDAGSPGIYTYHTAVLDDLRFGPLAASTAHVDLSCSYPIYASGQVDLACSYAIGDSAVTFSQIQFAASSSADPALATFGSTPTEGNLLVAIGFERSGTGTTPATISGSGWAKTIARDVSLGDTTYRRSLSVWWKVAGASEDTDVYFDDGSANIKRLLIVEYTAGTTATWALEDYASNDNGNTTNATSIATGTTGSIAAGDLLQIGILAVKHSSGSSGVVSWGSDALTQAASADVTTSHDRLMFAGWAQQSTSGTRASTATIGGTPWANVGLMAGILVFSASSDSLESAYVDLSCSYHIYEAGQTDLACSYAIREAAQADLSCSYAIREDSAIDFTGTYAIYEGAHVDLGCTYVIREGGTADLPCTYTILGAGQVDLVCSYAIRESAYVDFECSYPILESAYTEFACSYVIREAEQVDLSCSYQIREGATADLACTFQIRESATVDLACSYVIREGSHTDLACSYAICEAGSVDLSCSYGVEYPLGTGSVELACSYSIYASGEIDFNGSYPILESATRDLSCTYAIQEGSAVDLSCSYAIREAGTRDLACSYAILEGSTRDLSCSYAILEGSHVDLSCSYVVREGGNADLSCSYAIREAGSVDLLCSYAIEIELGSGYVELGCTYQIREAAQTDLSCTYQIREGSQADLSCSYAIRAVATVDLVCAYAIREASFTDLSCSYAILLDAYADLSASYAILVGSNTDLPCSYQIQGAGSVDLTCSYAIQTAAFTDLLCSYAILTENASYEVFRAVSRITKVKVLSSPITVGMSAISPITKQKNLTSSIDTERITQ